MAGPVVSGIDEIGLLPGSHVCAFYRGDSDRHRLLGGYFRQESSQNCAC